MTSTQLIVLALMVAAFVSGWVARGASARDAVPAEPARPAVPAIPEDTSAPVDASPLLADAMRSLERVIDAWIDGRDGVGELAGLERSRSRLREAAAARTDPELDDALAALAEAGEVFADLRRGRPLTAQASRRLARIEDRVARAAALAGLG